jgi:radical SAM superfamily enzyme YgiQ (UPF0313 family)
MKTLLLHIPKFNNHYKPIGDFIWLNYLPSGLLAIADTLQRHGHDVEVVHLGVEWIRDPAFRLAELIRKEGDLGAVGITLHWHHQVFDAVEAAKAIRRERPDLFIFAGGDTASFYHEEIVRDYPVFDAVVRGHGEIPALHLIKALNKEQGLGPVPNLTWRDGTHVVCNPLRYVGDAQTISALRYTNFGLLRHADTYIRFVGVPFFFAKRFSARQNRRMFSLQKPVFPVPLGRGCPFNCSWCSGSQIPQQKHISGLRGFIYRSVDSVVQSVREARAAGYRMMHSAMDPEPQTQHYFIELWRRMRRENIDVSWMFECNGLPTDDFLAAFKRAFPDPDSIIALSPECGNETLRRRHKGPAFSNAALLQKLETIETMGLAAELFFSYGLPGENEHLLEETIALQRRLSRRFGCIRAIRTLSIEIEPGAPWQLDPQRHGIVTNRRHFVDFYHAHADPGEGTFTSFGYYIPDYFDTPLDAHHPYRDFAARMQSIKCRRFCFIHPNPRKCGKHPWQGRLFCAVASRLVALKPRNTGRPY